MSDVEDLVEEVLATTPLVDGHNDWPYALRSRAGSSVEDLDGPRTGFHTDIPRLRAGRVGAQFWSVFVPSTIPEPEAVVGTLEQIDLVHRLVARYPGTFALACTADDVDAAFTSGRIASLIGAEGGHSIAGSLGVLRSLARLGVRYMTLTHSDSTAWADSATADPTVGGLSDVGRAVVAEMNRIGMLVDLSHTAETTQLDALEVARAPVIFSHSSARAEGDHPRNVSDEVLARLPTNGGVVQVTFVPSFISDSMHGWVKEAEEGLGKPSFPWARVPHPGEDPASAAEENLGTLHSSGLLEKFAAWEVHHPRPRVTVDDVVRHVEHVREVAGIEHVGLGGDYDGVDRLPEGLEDVSGYPRLLAALAERGWSASDLAALAGGNVLRVLRDAEDVAEVRLWPRVG